MIHILIKYHIYLLMHLRHLNIKSMLFHIQVRQEGFHGPVWIYILVPRELESAARVGLLGVEQSLKKNHDERSNNLIRHDTVASLKKPNPNENEILRVMDICILIGQTKFDQFWNGSFLV